MKFTFTSLFLKLEYAGFYIYYKGISISKSSSLYDTFNCGEFSIFQFLAGAAVNK